jgi:hypothetical protein
VGYDFEFTIGKGRKKKTEWQMFCLRWLAILSIISNDELSALAEPRFYRQTAYKLALPNHAFFMFLA